MTVTFDRDEHGRFRHHRERARRLAPLAGMAASSALIGATAGIMGSPDPGYTQIVAAETSVPTYLVASPTAAELPTATYLAPQVVIVPMPVPYIVADPNWYTGPMLVAVTVPVFVTPPATPGPTPCPDPGLHLGRPCKGGH